MHRTNVRKLYKTILRLHRALPNEMQQLGDQYVRDEFRRHKEISKEHVAPFMIEWADYCTTLAKQVGLRGPKTASNFLGKHLPPDKLDDFEEQQIVQLYELRKTIAPIPEESQASATAFTSSTSGSVPEGDEDDVKKLNSSQIKRQS